MDTPKKILLIRFKSIGDVLFTLPAAHVVREAFPGARISFLVSKENATLLQGFRDVDEVITMDRALYRRKNPKAVVMETISLLRRLRREHFSLVVDFQGYGETAMLTWITRAPERWGIVYQPARGWAYTRCIRRDLQLHPAEWNLSLLQQCGLRSDQVRNEFFLPEPALVEARQFCFEHGCDPARPMLYLQPFTSAPHKNWPFENYLALARFWRDHGLQVLFGGGPADSIHLKKAEAEGFAVATGIPRRIDIALLKLSTLVIGGDTGFVHLAVALGTRVLMLIRWRGPGSPVPFQHSDWIVTPPSGQRVGKIELEQVVRASVNALRECGLPVN